MAMTFGSTAIVENAIEQRRATVLRRQRDSFLALLSHAWRKSRFYRDLYSAAGITERDLAAVHLGDLPLIDKKLLMDNFDQAVTDPRLRKSDLERWIGEVGDPGLNYLDDFVVCQSSGSSGVKGVSVCAYRHWQLASSAMASRLPAPVNHGTGKTKVAFYLIVDGNHSGVSGAVRMPQSIYELCILSILDAKERVIDRLNEFQPNQLHGYASSIHELSGLALTGELRISPQRIFVSGEKLTGEMERQIHQAWASHLIDSYSAAESRFIAFKQSGETEMNIIDELNILEILDSAHRQVGTNGSGRAVLTNLYNATLPLIRYEMGDNLVCGAANLASPIKTIKEIAGRATDVLPVTLRDGGEGAISPLVLAAFYVPRLEKVQFVSLREDRVRINYVSAENLDRSIQIEFQRLLDCTAAARTTFEVCRAASIDPDPHTGKHCFVVLPCRPTSVAHVPKKSAIVTVGRAREPVSSSTSVIGSPQPPSQSMLKKPQDIPPLPPDQQSILRECFHPSASAVEFEETDVETSIAARFARMARLYGDRPAVIAGNDRLTYTELNRATNRVARAILAQRGSASEPIALLLETGVPAIIAILGVLKAGKAYVPLEANYPPARLALMLADSQAPMIIAERSTFPMLQATDPLQRSVLDINEMGTGFDDADLDVAIAPRDVAYIMYTSGSTGEPKGVIQNHRNILHKVLTHTHDYRICTEDRLSLFYSCSFSASVRCIFGALLNGAALLIYDMKGQGFTQVAKRIVDDRLTIYFSVPTLFRELAVALASLKEPSSLRLIYLASETVGKQDIDLYRRCFAPGCILVHALATSETGAIRQYFISKTTEIIGDLVPVGYHVRDREVLLLDEHRALTGWNRVGEIAVRGRFLSPGYWQRADLTKAKFLPDPDDPEVRIYLTGDLGLMRPDGCLEYHGRKDFQVKVRGHNVGVGEIEAMLREVGGVKDAVVVSRQNGTGETSLVSYVVPDGLTLPTSGALRHALAAGLPNPMIPSAFVIIDALPMTPNGKIDRRQLPEPGSLRPTLDHPYTAPRTPMERDLAAIWAEVLALDRVGVEDNFFDLGGHSLGAARILSRVYAAFNVDLSLKALFDRPTVAGMAQAILAEQVVSMPELINQVLSELELMADADAEKI
jgi:amino acid adenylation domain-containing protein